MTNIRKIDTGVARLPAMQRGAVADPVLAKWMDVVQERLEVREGERGNENERAITLRELNTRLRDLEKISEVITVTTGKDGKTSVTLSPAFTASVAVDGFAKSILESRLFKDINKTLDDATRFDDMPHQVRDVLLRSLTDEAAKRGAAIQASEQTTQTGLQSLALSVKELTAGVRQANAGVRFTSAAFSDGYRAAAYVIRQLQSSLGNYYQDGTPGRALLEEQLSTVADYSTGLRAQYTLKVQAGGALAGFGLAAEESVGGKASSAFIIQVDKFAIVSPSYTGGMMKTPRQEDLVFGVDSQGIYLQNNVYIKGNMRVDGAGKKLSDGLRGSLQVGASGYAWSDTTARQAIWMALGNSGSATNSNHLVIGDMVTVSTSDSAVTRHWNGSGWSDPGAVFNGDMLVDGTVAARKINTNGLAVRDNSGNIILSANGMDASWLKNLKHTQVSGLGIMATRNAAIIGSTVSLPDGSVLGTSDFVNRLSRIGSGNISNFMDVAAIGSAYIGNAAVGSLQIAGNAVTVPVALSVPYEITGNGSWQNLVTVYMYLDQPGLLYMNTGGYVGYGSGWTPVQMELKINGQAIARLGGDEGVVTAAMSGCVAVGAGSHTIQMNFMSGSKARVAYASIFAMGVKR